MKIGIDMHHNPMRGTVDCTGCGAPIVHMQDDWHEFLASQVAQARGEQYDRSNGTPAAWYPAMAAKAAEMLASQVQTYLFCPYCGHALQQPFHSDITGAPALPKPFANTFKGVTRWAQELGLSGLPADYQAWSQMAYAQRQQGKPVWHGR